MSKISNDEYGYFNLNEQYLADSKSFEQSMDEEIIAPARKSNKKESSDITNVKDWKEKPDLDNESKPKITELITLVNNIQQVANTQMAIDTSYLPRLYEAAKEFNLGKETLVAVLIELAMK